MTTLDKQIIFYFTGQDVTGHDAGMYPYFLIKQNSGGTSQIIFAGNFYYDGASVSLTFDVTDILANDNSVFSADDFEGADSVNNNLVNKYMLQITWANDDIMTSIWQWVAKVHSYTNRNETISNIFFNPDASSYTGRTSITIQGFSNSFSRDSKLIPHYPMSDDEQRQSENNCPFGLSFLAGTSVTGLTCVFTVSGYTKNFTITKKGDSFSYISSVGNVGDYRDIIPTEDGVLTVNGYKAAIFDVCPKRYYLFWQDRYGSFQCQAFNDYANYSETFDRSEVVDYRHRRRNAQIQIQSKWKLNSGWISEELYPYYESIYTSPVLILYDYKFDKRFSVMVSGNYDEKTYRNQKKMINMNLDLQENKTQNIIY